ncbi:MAG: phosphate/phosphite/phosphonate ABC transporter substrate-binding protein [Candidatus Competibacteraceae bacterium]|nr:phosphate/phosphite/phosphonate ABC transporter substrate-binding protein [Candidatus Competibacteraceae bacterium]MCP5124062.1 phosphate/phosphite/phosphonate ABC transporter substrate-binding protein [Gammaproteobacteria bacterium]
MIIFGLAAFSWRVGAVEDERTYSFAIVPQQTASELVESWSPLLSWLTSKTDIQLRFVTAPSIPVFEQRLAQGEYDFAYMNPYHYTVFSQKPGYQALIKEKDHRIKGILVTRKDSPIKALKDLEGKTLVFPSPAAFAASILPRAELRKQGITFMPKYVSSHDSVYINVAKGLYPAGGGIQRTLELAEESVRNDLKILWATQGYTPHAIAAHPRVPTEVANKFKSAFLQMNEDSEGRKLLDGISFTRGVAAATDADWDDVRALNIGLLDTLLK